MTSGRAGSLAEAGRAVETSLPAGDRTAAFVDLDILSANFRAVRAAVGEGREVLAVVKAEAYGHGGVEAARAFQCAGAQWLGVATVEEGESLRSADAAGGEVSLGGARVLVMSGAAPDVAPRVVSAGLEAAVWEMAQVEALAAAARAAGRRAAIHLKVDSGMGRLGIAPGEAVDFLRRASRMDGVEVVGLMSHLARADEEEEGEEATRRQFGVVRWVADALRREGLLPPVVHCANSAGGLGFPDAPGGMIRAGIALYGCPARPLRGLSLRLALTWKGSVIQAKSVGAGEAIGYGGIYRSERAGRIAVVGAGYGDGYPRLLSNRADALLFGRRAPVVGRVSMDMLTLDVSHLDGVRAGEEVVLLGAQGEECISAEELASRAETIPYEILCGVGVRVPRVYLRGGRAVGRQYLGGGAPRGDAG